MSSNDSLKNEQVEADDNQTAAENTPPQQQKLPLSHIIGSTVGAAFGVRNSKAHEQDFAQAKASTYIIAGIIFTALFVLTVLGVVKLVLGSI